jgi:Cof subfamily protein (haloacid dehalogenase superfamily)
LNFEFREKGCTMEYKLLFLDIDGTILKPDHTYTDSTKDAISQIKEQGIEVFIATGRPIHEVRELGKELNVDSFIGQNGAYAVYKNRTIIDEPLNRNQVQKFLDIAQENNHEMVLYTSEKNYYTSLDNPLVTYFNQTFQLRNNALFTNEVIDQITGMTVMNLTSSQTSLYEQETNIHLSQVNVEGSQHAYDIIRNNVNKGEAVKNVLQRLNLLKEQSIAFGDGMNDKEMLQAVGEGFAMENAHPDLFDFAKHKTTSVTDSGIYNGLKKLGLVK